MPFWQRSKCIYNRNMKLYTIALVALLPCLAATPDVDKGKALGLPTAPLRMEIFSDFTCPHCRAQHEETLPLLMKEFVVSGKLYIIDRAFPLTGPGHQYSREAFGHRRARRVRHRQGRHRPIQRANPHAERLAALRPGQSR